MKILFSLFGALMLLTCDGSKSPKIKIKTGHKSNIARPGDSLKLSVVTSLEKDYQVSYFLNDKPIKEDYQFSISDKLGDYKIKALIKKDNKSYQSTVKFTLLASKSPNLYTYQIINTYPHDIEAYTQGLEFDNEILYESTGLNGKSSLRKIDYLKGKVLNSINLNESFFGEGLTLFDDKIIQLTWKSKKGFIYNKNDMKIEKSFPYQESKEGWGLCNDNKYLYKSDGTHFIWVLDPENYNEVDKIQVMTNKTSLKNLNELEWVEGKIYANTYQFNKDVVVIIDPKNGAVEGVIDFSGLKEKVKQHKELNVLNGIAYHKQRKTLFVTGKNWNKLFEVKITPKI